VSNGPVYVYDPAGQYQEPAFVVYQLEHVQVVARALGWDPNDLHVSRVRLHPYERDRYKNTGGGNGFNKAHVSF
jgi:hypothetical protein